MAISIFCECGRQYAVKEELAGKKVQCKECGQPIAVPARRTGGAVKKSSLKLPATSDDDEFDERPTPAIRSNSKSKKKRRSSVAKTLWLKVAIGSVAMAAVIGLAVAYWPTSPTQLPAGANASSGGHPAAGTVGQPNGTYEGSVTNPGNPPGSNSNMAKTQNSWTADPNVIAELGQEIDLGGYSICPPKGWKLTLFPGASISRANGVAQYHWTIDGVLESVGTKDTLGVLIKNSPRSNPENEPLFITSKEEFQRRMEAAKRDPMSMTRETRRLEPHLFAEYEVGTINGQRFHRIFYPKKLYSGHGARAEYQAFLRGVFVSIWNHTENGESSASFPLLEAATQSFRIGVPKSQEVLDIRRLVEQAQPEQP